jgi:hypothetical protein
LFGIIVAPAAAGRAETPPSVDARIETTLPASSEGGAALALDGKEETFFRSGRRPDEKDHFAVKFSRPLALERVEVRTGGEDGAGRLGGGVLEISADGKEYREAARFESGVARAEAGGAPVAALRIRPAAAAERGYRLVIREIALDPPPAVGKVTQGLLVTADTSEVPDLEEWGRRARDLCVEWHPRISALLASDGHEPPLSARLLFFKEMRGIANASGSDIRIAARWVREHPDDFGMVIHELTHTIQAYRAGNRPGWLVEGIADYIRIVHFEPHAPRPRINPARASYRDAYKTTAMFLEWAEKRHDPALVNKLNAALRGTRFDEGLFRELTGKTVDELWQDFVSTLARRARV